MGKQRTSEATSARADMPPAEMRPLGWFFADKKNPRVISDAELEGLADDIAKFGLVQNLVANHDGMLIGGHQRHKATVLALTRAPKDGRPWQLGLDQDAVKLYAVPTVVLELSRTEARVLNLALNKRGGDWDYAMLPDVFAELSTLSLEDQELSGFSKGEIDDIAALLEGPATGGAGPTTDTRTSHRRFTIEVDTDDEAEACRTGLKAFGMQGSGEGAARAFVAAMRAATRRLEEHPEEKPAVEKRGKKR